MSEKEAVRYQFPPGILEDNPQNHLLGPKYQAKCADAAVTRGRDRLRDSMSLFPEDNIGICNRKSDFPLGAF